MSRLSFLEPDGLIRERLWKSTVSTVLISILGICICGNALVGLSPTIASVVEKNLVIFRSPETQWISVLCLAAYAVTFIFIRYWMIGWNGFPLLLVLFFALYGYWFNSQPAYFALDALVFMSSIAIGQGVAILTIRKRGTEINHVMGSAIGGILLVVAVAALWPSTASHTFEYHGQLRQSGIWKNPNTYGLLVALGMVLNLTLCASFSKNQRTLCSNVDNKIASQWTTHRRVIVLFLLVAFLAMICGFFRSYSRGAWVAFFCGLLYFSFQHLQGSLNRSHMVEWARCNTRSLVALIVGVVVLAIVYLRYSEHSFVKRLCSIGNVNDFSWRNRLWAWEGSLEMMFDRIWWGFGWNGAMKAYEQHYSTVMTSEVGAIQMNDYLNLGIMLGTPALIAFLVHIESGLRRKKAEILNRSRYGGDSTARIEIEGLNYVKLSLNSEDLITVCRSGAIVLLVGFWFDGGLFNLATAVPFWILVELSNSSFPDRTI